MTNNTALIPQLLEVTQILERHQNLEDGLQEIALETAQMLEAQRCSIILFSEEDSRYETCYLKVFTHHLSPITTYSEISRLHEGIAGYVAATGEPLLIENINRFRFVTKLPTLDESNPSWISAPIVVDKHLIGVISLCSCLKGEDFKGTDLQQLKLLAHLIGQSIHIMQLKTILNSRFVGMAVASELEKHPSEELAQISPDPSKLAKIVAKAFFRELTRAGFGTNQIIRIASEVLNLLQTNLDKHCKRLARDNPS